MKKPLLAGCALLLLATGAAHADVYDIPPGFMGDWCVSGDPAVAHRKEIVGPCKKTLRIRAQSFRNEGDECIFKKMMRTILHTQLIRYKCKSGKNGSVSITIDSIGKTNLETLYIDSANDSDWKEWEDLYKK